LQAPFGKPPAGRVGTVVRRAGRPHLRAAPVQRRANSVAAATEECEPQEP